MSDKKSFSFITISQRKEDFQEAKKMALQLDKGRIKRVRSTKQGIDLSCYKAGRLMDGTAVVIGDDYNAIPFPNQIINGYPAVTIQNLNTQMKWN